jgi:hypothetical protein
MLEKEETEKIKGRMRESKKRKLREIRGKIIKVRGKIEMSHLNQIRVSPFKLFHSPK